MAINSASLMQHLRSASLDALQSARMGEVKPAAAQATGELMGTAFVVESDPLAELMDSMEELSYLFEEKGAKKLSERKLGEMRKTQSAYTQALENWMKTLPDMPNSAFLAQLLQTVRMMKSERGQLPTPERLLQMLSEGSVDPSHLFAMLDILEQALGGAEDDELRTLLQSARKTLLDTQGDKVRVGINLAREVNAHATTPEEMQGLRDLYRSEILGFSTPQDCFRSIMGKRGGVLNLQQTIDFLTEGCGVDLQSPTPSQSPEELRRILLDLQCVQVLKTVFDRLSALGQRMITQVQETPLLNGEQMTGRVMEFTERTNVSAAMIANFIAQVGLMKWLAQMDFCRELTLIFRQLSSRLFQSERDRLRLVDATQEELDELIAMEDEESQDQEDATGGQAS